MVEMKLNRRITTALTLPLLLAGCVRIEGTTTAMPGFNQQINAATATSLAQFASRAQSFPRLNAAANFELERLGGYRGDLTADAYADAPSACAAAKDLAHAIGEAEGVATSQWLKTRLAVSGMRFTDSVNSICQNIPAPSPEIPSGAPITLPTIEAPSTPKTAEPENESIPAPGAVHATKKRWKLLDDSKTFAPSSNGIAWKGGQELRQPATRLKAMVRARYQLQHLAALNPNLQFQGNKAPNIELHQKVTAYLTALSGRIDTLAQADPYPTAPSYPLPEPLESTNGHSGQMAAVLTRLAQLDLAAMGAEQPGDALTHLKATIEFASELGIASPVLKALG